MLSNKHTNLMTDLSRTTHLTCKINEDFDNVSIGQLSPPHALLKNLLQLFAMQVCV